MTTRVVIEDLVSSKNQKQDSGLSLKLRQEIQNEINSFNIPKKDFKSPIPFQDKKILKEHKANYKKLSREFKDSLLEEFLSYKAIPNMNLVILRGK